MSGLTAVLDIAKVEPMARPKPASGFRQTLEKLAGNPAWVVTALLLVNLPLFILTFDTTNWSDDYQYIHLLALKARFSPLASVLLEPTGGRTGEAGHFAPVYNLFNIAISAISLDPRVFHLVVLFCFALTAWFIYLSVRKLYGDAVLGLLSAGLFSVNYYVGFSALVWNCFHSHATNTLTGVISLYAFIRYVKEGKKIFLVLSAFFLMLTVLNYESGFAFFPILMVVLGAAVLKRWLRLGQAAFAAGILLASISTYFVGAYALTGDIAPLGGRLGEDRQPQTVAFYANELFIESSGFAFPYNKFVFEPLKRDLELKNAVSRLVRNNDREPFFELPTAQIGRLVGLLMVTAGALIGLSTWIWKRVRSEIRLVAGIFVLVLAVNVFVLYRSDVANALGVFSSIILADFILSLARDERRWTRWVGILWLAGYALTTIGSIADRFQDSYQKSVFRIYPVATKGPDRIYRDINRRIGRFAENGIVFFVHDYSEHSESTGSERIGTLIGIPDYACFNASVFADDVLRTEIDEEYRHKPLIEFFRRIALHPHHQQVVVESKEEALEYLRVHGPQLAGVEAVYISRDYGVSHLTPRLR